MSETASSVTATPTPQIVTGTKFMQNYQVASAVNGGSDVVAVCNGSGQVELFTIGTDSTVWNFAPDPSSDTGYSQAQTGLVASALAVGVDSSGHIVVFAANGLQLQYVVETNTATSRWSAPQTVPVPQPLNATKIARIIAQEIAGSLYVGVLTQYTSAINPSYALAYSVWQTSTPVFQRPAAMNVNSLTAAWVGNSAQTAAFASIDTVIIAYVVSTGQVTRYPMAATFQSIDADAANDSTGNTQIFAILADGNLYHLVGGANNQAYSWVQLSQQMTFRQIEVDTDGGGNVQVFVVSGDNRLYHLEPMASSTSGYSEPAPILAVANAALIGVAGNDGGDIDVFAVGTVQNSLIHLFQEEVSGNWVSQTVHVQTSGQVEEYISYTSDVTVYDAAGALMANTPVTMWASEEALITVNGAVYFTDPYRPARLSTNGAGMLSIAQETGSLAIPALQLNIPSVMSPGASLAIQQSTDVQNRLATVSGPDLMNAQDASGNYLLADQYRNTQTTDGLASAFNQAMKLPLTPPTATASFLTRQGPKPGVWYRPAGSVADLRRLTAPSEEQHWQLSFEGGAAAYRTLTRQAAQALLAEKRASVQSAGGVFDWLEDIGDFLEGVVEGIVKVVDTVVTTIGDAVQAVFTFIVDGVTYLFEAVVTFVEQAFDIVETFFAQVGVIFEKIFEWLGFLFSWPDMLRTHEALAYTINQMLSFLPGAAAGIQTMVDNGISDFQNRVSAAFDYAVNNIAGSSTLGGYNQSNEQSSPEFSSSTSNNIVLNGLTNNASAASVSSSTLAAVDDDPLSQLMQQIENLASSTQSSQAFAAALSYFQNLGGSPDQIFSQLLAGLLRVVEGVILAMLSGVQAILDAMLELAQTLATALQAVLNETWDIPFVSDFYSWLTDGAELTTLDLIALIIAIPTTIIYKIIYNAAPFPDEDSVTAFKNSFSAQTMLQAAGFGSSAAQATAGEVAGEPASTGGLLPTTMATLVAVAGAVSTFVFGVLTAILDAKPTDTGQSTLSALSKWAFVFECSGQACSFPWWFALGAPSCDQTNPDGVARTMWIYQIVGILMDATFIKLAGVLPENFNDAGIAIQELYAIGHLTFAITASEFASALAGAANVIPVIPEICKPLRSTGIIEATSGISLIVMAGIDGVFYLTGAILNFVNSTESITLALAPGT